MSSVTTSKIDTRDGTTNLTLTTGNTTGAAIVINTSNTITLKSNSIFDVITANSSATRANTTLTVTGAATLSNTLSTTGLATFSANVNVTGNVTANVISSNIVSSVNATISSNTLNLGTPSLSTTGFSRMPNGLLMQWGSISSSSTVGDITFPAEFGTLYSITATAVGTAVHASYATTFLAANTTTANVRTANTNSRTVYWQAIGV